MKKKKSSIPKKILLLIVANILVFNLFGCFPQNEGKKTSSTTPITRETISQQDLASELLTKYGIDESNEYLPPIDPIPRDHKFAFHINFDPSEFPEYQSTYDLVGVFADPEFTQWVPMEWESTMISESEYDILITPDEWPAAGIPNKYGSSGQERKLSEDLNDIEYVDDKGDFKDWGNLPRYYLVQFADLDTGEKLEKPLVQVFTVQTELQAPKTTVFVDEYGKLSIRWEPVEGAERYVIFGYRHEDDPKFARYWKGENLDAVDGRLTEWHAANNRDFMRFENAAESLYPEKALEGTDLVERTRYLEVIGVMAIGADGHSSLDSLHKTEDIENRLAYRIAKHTWDEDRYLDIVYIRIMVSTMDEMPSQIPVQMCDGSIVYKTVEYDYDSALTKTERLYETDGLGSGEALPGFDVNVLEVIFRLPQTDIAGRCWVEEPPNTWEADLAQIEKRQEGLARASMLQQSRETIQQRRDEHTNTSDDNLSDIVEVIPIEVFATNALSEYLAVNLLAGKEKITLTDFPQASDTEFLTDAINEAYYQNPLILGITDMYLDREYNLIVEYEDAPGARSQKQDAILREIERIIPEIITPGMTDLEKEIAINKYLCDTIEYDMALFEEAQGNNFTYIDSKYFDSFTVYGALINGISVCSGYAAAFQMLARAAGLEAIVITGTLEGSLGHAWNRVLINGEWTSIDPTNNDSPQLYNVFFNLPDDVVGGILVEDKEYILDNEIDKYFALDDSFEYYHITGDFYTKDIIVEKLTDGLQNNSAVALRTDYTITDAEYRAIAKEVRSKTGIGKLYGCHLLGLIYLSTESF